MRVFLLPVLWLILHYTASAQNILLTGEAKTWHNLTLTFGGPKTDERDKVQNPFLDYRLDVTFTHQSGSPRYVVPGYYAADGNAAETSATAGTPRS